VIDSTIRIEDVSKFYGDVLGVNRVDLVLEPGTIGLVGPNGSGKSTLLNLIAGLLHPDRGRISVLGSTPRTPEMFFRVLGYCTQHDSFPKGMTGRRFVTGFLRVRGFSAEQAWQLAYRALESVRLLDAADRRIDGYSNGMRQRIKLAQAIAHEPLVLVLDEPLNGLDPIARAEVIALLHGFAARGAHVLISSHILHEVDAIADRVVVLNDGYVMAEGDLHGMKGEMTQHAARVAIRSDQAAIIAAHLFKFEHIIEARLHGDGRGLHVHTRDADRFFRTFNRLVLEERWSIDAIGPAHESDRKSVV
jgi:ABC-2 type transport system ATP-binding protein